MPASVDHRNKATEEEPKRIPDQAGDTKAEAAPSSDGASESQAAAPGHSTSAFKPDPFW